MRKTQAEDKLPVGLSIESVQGTMNYLARLPYIFQTVAAAHPFSLEETLLYLAKNATIVSDNGGTGPLNELIKRDDLPESVAFELFKNRHFPKEMFLVAKNLPSKLACMIVEFFIDDNAVMEKIVQSESIPNEALHDFVLDLDFSLVQTMARHCPNFEDEMLDIIMSRSDMEDRVPGREDEIRMHCIYYFLVSNSKLQMTEKFQLRVLKDVCDFPEKILLKFAKRKDLSEKVIFLLAEKKNGIIEVLLENKHVPQKIKRELKSL